jgi:TfoX/Sxy family transcriptional regulator of competence genes
MARSYAHFVAYRDRMVYDEHLAERVRELIAAEDGITEKRMFGGLAFLVDGKMAVTVSRVGGLMLRIDPDDTPKLLQRDHTDPFVMRGREMTGWIRVDSNGVRTKRQLQSWVERGLRYARTLTP